MSDKQRIRVGIDVGGTFTKAVAINAKTGSILSKSTVPTTHKAERGVSEGIVSALSNILEESKIDINDIELISHSTTQAINALLESDTSKVGIIAMGVGPSKKDVVKRTNLQEMSGNNDQNITTFHEFLDTSHLITENEVKEIIDKLKSKGAQVIVATEAFGVDDPSNELFVMNTSAKCNIPSTASHEISGVYGLEIRTLTAAVNASVLPKTFQVANYVEEAIRKTGVIAPLMIMKGDGGVSSMDTFRTKPILTVLSGPAASVAGALLYLKVTNGIFVEVGGTSTNICIIKNGKPEIRYVTVNQHPTCIRSMDVRILGVAGGSMVSLSQNRVSKVGPRSAHIAGLKYSCFADPDDLKTGKIIQIKPKENDIDEYVAIKCENGTYAITNTCAANALEMIEKGDYSFANQESAKIALKILAEHIGVHYHEVAQSIINTASFEINKTIVNIMKEFKLNSSVKLIGGGGGASVLVPFVAKQLGFSYEKAEHADVISSIGVASSMLQEEIEQTMDDATPEKIAKVQKKIHTLLVDKGAIPESIIIDSEYISEKALLRVTAIGNIELDSVETSKNIFTLGDAKTRASEIIDIPEDLIDLGFETDHYFVFIGHVEVKKLFNKKNQHHILILDRYGKMKLSLKNGQVFQGGKISMIEELDDFLESRHSDIAPKVFLLNDLKLVDYSSLTSSSKILDGIRDESKKSEKTAIIVEL
ncbi:MAG TPA: hydantoinase/oxoprolinase family protein [Nitrosopumilus sp.]|jgi:N-methylhydantoinase A/oxoprolinase/acetone carboxylase beta subunit|nr:methylhydantoinase [Nitrososphaerota archaeon]MDP6327785.1 hydantoinase/oxoprolinase family protein [Nitrosopumilus sp.]HJM25175.1 hydantoinase/oxoprolinase family protein [Nitrosopumilus sp.]HJO31586.1 hydantoinase/oxoprolinase family protein [Nitrosopumilus sp.]|tara:strand:- start:1582 stop:3699 length:2118 start_codon:yes stop_codon:yes gene_type:complete